MRCQQVAFANGHCLVEVTAQTAEPGFVARLSVIENEGALVRPLVSQDGRRVKILGGTESEALDSAVKYLSDRFGAVSDPDETCALGAAAIGRPFIVAPTSNMAAMAS